MTIFQVKKEISAAVQVWSVSNNFSMEILSKLLKDICLALNFIPTILKEVLGNFI